MCTNARQKKLTPDDVGDSAKEDIRASALHFAAIRIIVYVTHGLPRTESAQDQLLAVTVNHVHEIRVRRVQASPRVLRVEKRPRGIQSCSHYENVRRSLRYIPVFPQYSYGGRTYLIVP